MKKLYLISIVIISLLLSGGLGYWIGKNNVSKAVAVSQANDYQAGWDALKDRINKSGIINEISALNSITGSVSQKDNGIISVNLFSINPLDAESLDGRQVKIDDTTEIYTMIERDSAEYQAEMDDYTQNNPSRGPDGAANIPVRFSKETRTVADIALGQTVVVKTDENIKDKKEFTAKEIIIQKD